MPTCAKPGDKCTLNYGDGLAAAGGSVAFEFCLIYDADMTGTTEPVVLDGSLDAGGGGFSETTSNKLNNEDSGIATILGDLAVEVRAPTDGPFAPGGDAVFTVFASNLVGINDTDVVVAIEVPADAVFDPLQQWFVDVHADDLRRLDVRAGHR